MEIKILVKSKTQSKPRAVSIKQDEFGLSFFCNCPAGKHGELCKHKMAVASGDDTVLYDEKQGEDFKKIADWVNQSDYPDLIKELKETQNNLASVQDKFKELEFKITQGMNEGLR